MRTLSVVQLVLLCVSISFGTSRENFIPLWQICLPSFVTQVALVYYSFFKFKTLRVVCMGFMGISLLCSVFLALVSFLRFSRFVFFPVKEDILFALECLARFPLEFLQLANYQNRLHFWSTCIWTRRLFSLCRISCTACSWHTTANCTGY